MPFDKSPEKFNRLVENASQAVDILEWLRRRQTTDEREQLAAEVRQVQDTLWTNKAGEIEQWERDEAGITSDEAEVDKLFPRPSHVPPEPPPPEPPSVRNTGWGFLAAWLAASTARWLFSVPAVTPSPFDSPEDYAVVIVFLAPALVLLGFTALRRLDRWVYTLFFRKTTETLRQRNIARHEERKKRRIDERRAALNNFEERIDRDLSEGPIRELMRKRITRWTKPPYSTKLEILEASGLAEIIDPSRTVDTEAKGRLQYMLENMPGGSIGIAGPRGSGKSTLIHAYCGPRRVKSDIKGKPILPIMVSAPVKYDARDFILYLFAATCRSVLATAKVDYDESRTHLEEGDFEPEPLNATFKLFLRVAPRLCFWVGSILVALSLAVALLLAAYGGEQPAGKTAGVGAGQEATAPGAPDSAQAGGAQNGRPPDAPAAKGTEQAQPMTTPTAIRFFRTLELKPGGLLLWGVVLLLTWLVMRRAVTYQHKEFEYMQRRRRAQVYQLESSLSLFPRPNMTAAELKLRESMASRVALLLREIKFQLSYTSGWSGALKLPVGLEGGVQKAYTLSERQWSNPEIVARFTSMLDSIPEEYRVIIGIDELDKLESDEQAQLFLNEIKNIFGVSRCFYLISVSENAMSNFERRGLPFRDVFDSSFDSIVYVDYMSLATCKSLIEGRIIGRPVPFMCLSYCLSGGLARDMIRTFRYLLELRQASSPADDLSALCRTLVGMEVRAKARAVSVSAKRLEVTQDVSPFLEELHRLACAEASDESLLSAFQFFRTWAVASPPDKDGAESSKDEAHVRSLKALKGELAAYTYFCLTLLEFFTNSLAEETLKTAEDKGQLLDLARARQALAVDPGISISLINSFRKSQSLTVPAFPKLPPASRNGGELDYDVLLLPVF